MSRSRDRWRALPNVLFLLPVLLAFAGCMIGPNYQRPKVSVSQSFGEAGDPRLSAEQTNYRDWWKAFNDPVLDRLIARAYQDSFTLQ
jgi:outer membrane protein TolC